MKPTIEYRPGKKAAGAIPKPKAKPPIATPSGADAELAKLRAQAQARSKRYREGVKEKLYRLAVLEGKA